MQCLQNTWPQFDWHGALVAKVLWSVAMVLWLAWCFGCHGHLVSSWNMYGFHGWVTVTRNGIFRSDVFWFFALRPYCIQPLDPNKLDLGIPTPKSKFLFWKKEAEETAEHSVPGSKHPFMLSCLLIVQSLWNTLYCIHQLSWIVLMLSWCTLGS